MNSTRHYLLKRVVLFLILFCLYKEAMSCSCFTNQNLKIGQKESYLAYDQIFIGRVTFLDDFNFEFEVLEVFKGSDDVATVKGQLSGCSIFPEKIGELWLVYSSKEDNGNFFTSYCGLSRSFENPFTFSFRRIHFPVPPMPTDREQLLPNKIDESINEEKRISKAKIKALRILKNEIKRLRKYKLKEN